MTEAVTIEQRMDTRRAAAAAHGAMAALESTIELDPRLRELVRIRASIVNGCAYCLQLHSGDALEAGEEQHRIVALAAWEESPFFDERERAALALTDAVTLVGEGHVPDTVWHEAASCFGEADLAQLLFAIVAINAWNRLAIATRKTPVAPHA